MSQGFVIAMALLASSFFCLNSLLSSSSVELSASDQISVCHHFKPEMNDIHNVFRQIWPPLPLSLVISHFSYFETSAPLALSEKRGGHVQTWTDLKNFARSDKSE